MRVVETRYVRPTRSGHLLALSGAVLVGLYVVTQLKSALLVGGLLLGIPLASYLYTVMAVSEIGRRLIIERNVAGSAVEAYAAPIVVAFHSLGWIMGYVHFTDTPPKGITPLTKPAGGGILLPWRVLEASYLISPRIGRWRFGPLTVTFSDPLGLAEAVVIVEPDGARAVAGTPSRGLAEEVSLVNVEDPYSTPTSRLIKREGTEIYGIREFQEGDELRLIDWKATARLGKLFVRELRRETTIPVLFLFVPTPRMLEGEPYKTPFEQAARAIYKLSRELAGRDGIIGILSISGTETIAAPPAKGLEGVARVVEALSLTPPPKSAPKGVVDLVLEYLRKHSPGRSVIVLVTDREASNVYSKDLEYLVEKRLRVALMVVEREEIALEPVRASA